MSYDNPSNSDDVVDSRSIEDYIETLENEIEARRDQHIFDFTESREESFEGEPLGYPDDDEDSYADRMMQNDLVEEQRELKQLIELRDDVGSSEWRHGLTLIRESYFVEYAQQYADDVGAIDRNATWPLNHIDWDAAADDLRADYAEVEWDGVTYLFLNS